MKIKDLEKRVAVLEKALKDTKYAYQIESKKREHLEDQLKSVDVPKRPISPGAYGGRPNICIVVSWNSWSGGKIVEYRHECNRKEDLNLALQEFNSDDQKAYCSKPTIVIKTTKISDQEESKRIMEDYEFWFRSGDNRKRKK